MSEHGRTDIDPDRPRSRFAFLLRPWFLIVVTILLILVAIPLTYRSTRLSAIPPIEEIVDLQTEGRVTIEPAENAFTFYERAWKLTPSGLDVEVLYEALGAFDTGGWETVSLEARNSLDQCEPKLAEWRRGTELKLAARDLPADMDWYNQGDLSDSETVTSVALLMAARCQHDGRLDEAWQWLRAVFRFSRHLGNPGPSGDRYAGTSIHASACQRLVAWAADSRVTTEQLTTALTEVRDIYRNTVANSTCLRLEYVINVNSLSNPELLKELCSWLPVAENLPTSLHGVWLFVNAEPQVGLLLQRHLISNYLSQCDLPRWERTPAGTSAELFLPTGKEVPPLIDPRTLDDLLSRSPIGSMFGADFYLIENSDNEQALQSALELCLMAELFRRRHGSYPDSLDALVPEFVAEIPRDLFGPTLADRMLMFRREAAAVVKPADEFEEESFDTLPGLIIYSRGSDGTDDEGRVDSTDDTGLRIPIPPPGASQP